MEDTAYNYEWLKRVTPAAEDPAIRQLLVTCLTGTFSEKFQRWLSPTQVFAYTFLSDWFEDEPIPEEEETWRVLDDDTLPWAGENAFRGWGKTTKVQAKAMKGFLFRQSPFWCHVKNDGDLAAADTEPVKMALLTNPAIREVFGNLKAKSYEGTNPQFSKQSWFLCDPKSGEPFACCVPKGIDQYIRGIKAPIGPKLVRVTWLTIDDAESDKTINNFDLRKRNRDRFDDAVLNVVNKRKTPLGKPPRWVSDGTSQWTPPWRVFYTDSYKHHDAQMAHLMNDSSWKIVKRPKSDVKIMPDGSKKYFSLIPSLFTDEQIEAEVETARRKGNLDGYAREQMCRPTSPENASWTRDSFKYYSEVADNLAINERYEYDRAIIVDIAHSVSARSATTCMTAMAANTITGRVYVRANDADKYDSVEGAQMALTMAVKLNSNVIAVEVTGAKQELVWIYTNEASQMGLDIRWIWLTGKQLPQGDFGTGKEAPKKARASLIRPYYTRGIIYHDESLREGPLETDLCDFPRCTSWDRVDTLGHIPKVLSELGRFFLPQVDNEIQVLKFNDGYNKKLWDRALRKRECFMEAAC